MVYEKLRGGRNINYSSGFPGGRGGGLGKVSLLLFLDILFQNIRPPRQWPPRRASGASYTYLYQYHSI